MTEDNTGKGITRIIIYITPLIIFLIGIITYFVVIPKLYGQVVSFVDWLFADPSNIISTLRDSDIVLSKIHYVIAIRVFWYLWVLCFTVSLFFVGKQIQIKSKMNAVDVVLTKNESHLIIIEILNSLKELRFRHGSEKLDNLIMAVKRLEEKLAIESDFGYGDTSVISCENDIARQLLFMSELVARIDSGNLNENLESLSHSVSNVNLLLGRRTELKRK